VLQDGGEVAVTPVEQLHQVVLDFHVVVGTPETEARGRLDGGLGLVVQLSDEGAQVEVHTVAFALRVSESCRPGRG
jgi:hypothetical protein